ncbi:phosphoribosyltransferase [Mucilaginibacter sp. AW1-7]|uniref:phosphoribosyltransferase n=1 Tax=Mucilaginibacter sp. AW1-7 TaxID=3349874 RepID=UPI003F74004B
MFHDRIEVGRLLAAQLKKYQNDSGIVLAVPRGGVPIAYTVARQLGFPLDIVLTKKIGHPGNKEYAIGAASLSDHFVVPHRDVPDVYIQRELVAIRARLQEMYQKFMDGKTPEDISGKTVFVIDDGMATGNTIKATVKLLRKGQPGKIVVGVPVASKESIQKLANEADEIVALQIPEVFYGVGAFYENFSEVSDEEVTFYLDKFSRLRKAG